MTLQAREQSVAGRPHGDRRCSLCCRPSLSLADAAVGCWMGCERDPRRSPSGLISWVVGLLYCSTGLTLSTSSVSVVMDAAASGNVFAGSVAEFVKKWAECEQA